MHNKQAILPQSNSTGRSSKPQQIVHRADVMVCVLGSGIERSVEGKKESGAIAVNRTISSLGVLVLGLPSTFVLPPRASTA